MTQHHLTQGLFEMLTTERPLYQGGTLRVQAGRTLLEPPHTTLLRGQTKAFDFLVLHTDYLFFLYECCALARVVPIR